MVITDVESGSTVEFNSSVSDFDNAVSIFLPFSEEFIAQSIGNNVSVDGVFDFNINYDVVLTDAPCCGSIRLENFNAEDINFGDGGTSNSIDGFVIFVEF